MFSTLNQPLTILVDRAELNDPALAKLVTRRPRDENEDTEDTEAQEQDAVRINIPSVITICSGCDGRGHHSKRFGAFSGRRLEEAQEDEEFWEGYTSGAFDEKCEVCDGQGRVNVPAEHIPARLAELIATEDQEEAEDRAVRRAEYLMEGGWREEGWYGD